MPALPLIAQIYLLCASLGALFFTLSAVLGAAHEGGHGGHGGDGGGHAGIGHGSGHTAIGHGQAAHGALGHSAAHGAVGHGAGHSTASGHGGAGHGSGHGSSHGSGHGDGGELLNTSQALTALPGADKNQRNKRAQLLVMLLNPSTYAAFLAWFGATGLVLFEKLPWLPLPFSVAIAVIGGVLGTRLSLQMVGWLTSKMYSSKNFHVQSLIGYEAEVTSVIADARMGEIFYKVGGRRYSAPAKALNPDTTFKRGDHVYIQDMRDHVAYVEAILDEGAQFEAKLGANFAPGVSQRLTDNEDPPK